MKIHYSEQTGSYDITELAWDEGYRIYLAIKKISELLTNTQYDSEYYKQEANRLKGKYQEIIAVLDNGISKDIAQGLDEQILELV